MYPSNDKPNKDKLISSTLKDNSSDVRDDAEDLNNEDRKIATPRNNSKK
jgi:hypothetical protein|tara:strand:+ start:516 stop:662 length:147 start_codon:yes stop_codon:yes gene_type:complete